MTIGASLQSLLDVLVTFDQRGLIKYLQECSPEERASLVKQVNAYDINTLKQVLSAEEKKLKSIDFEPLSEVDNYEDMVHQSLGNTLLSEGKVACLLVAGGQGSRLGFDHPKGMFPITAIKNKSLFQYLSEKVLSASRKFSRQLSLAIMVSPEHEDMVRNFFDQHDYFGLDAKYIDIFTQTTLPFVDFEGNLFLESSGCLAEAPGGNGTALHDLMHAGIGKKWSQRGIEYVQFIQIDNPLSDPFDANLVGFHAHQGNEISVKCVKRERIDEAVGLLVLNNKQVRVVEYTEVSREDREKITKDGSLLYCHANTSMFIFSLDFLDLLSSDTNKQLPLHKVRKRARYLNEAGDTCWSKEPIAWKFERFIFDVFEFASKIGVTLADREKCFSPLKNAEGKDSISTVQDSLLNNDRRVWKSLCQTEPTDTQFELSLVFYYPTEAFSRQCVGKVFPEKLYIDKVEDK